jgi:hypothetical protein
MSPDAGDQIRQTGVRILSALAMICQREVGTVWARDVVADTVRPSDGRGRRRHVSWAETAAGHPNPRGFGSCGWIRQ